MPKPDTFALFTDFERTFTERFAHLDFAALRADLSFWHNTTSHAQPLLETLLPLSPDLHHYRTDYRDSLAALKHDLLPTLRAWDAGTPHSPSHITLCHSTTLASLSILHMLKEKGIREIQFTTPAYFACPTQARQLGLRVTFLPARPADAYAIHLPSAGARPKALWVTQPRFCVGTDHTPAEILALHAALAPRDFLIIDEANEQRHPTPLAAIDPARFPNIVKYRNLFKPCGIQGPRLGYLIHHPGLSPLLQTQLDILQGGIDCFSLELARTLCSHGHHPRLLALARSQVAALHRKAQALLQGSPIRLSPIANSYLGSLLIPCADRNALLDHCAARDLPVILGSSLFLPPDPTCEHIRLDYLIREDLFLNGLRILLDFTSGFGVK